jgi:hypothetical protein
MTRFVRLSLLAVASAALVACGGGAKLGGGKEGAAQALFEASQPAGKGGQGNYLQALLAGQTSIGAEVKVDCSKGGSVALKVDLSSIGNSSGNFKYNLEYDDCSEDGVNEYNGEMSMEFIIDIGSSSGSISMRLKGEIEISGEIDDFIDADVTETISFDALSATSGSVTVKINGSIKTSEGSYTYTNESITITVGGELPAAVDGNS